ncbi:P1 family peptidase [Caulobacter sp. 17J65-9]|uniref:P1 family peptidase n=1 Tax=Caulobacter sp. 17J65-9 TaxID=2709382 RepID=UPI0013C638FF|nr:P1 family peptidase [Caulobacter sp. 17J65-9]NEX94448.1 P1 family peptidase [Caulobacter sp. 17J65-9]
MSSPDSPRRAGPGPRNLITDVAGLSVGSAHDEQARTGVTVVLADALTVAAIDVSGGGPGTREGDALAPENLVGRVDAVVLSGGSVYGLGAADGVCAGLGAGGRGFRLRDMDGVPPSPIVPAAILYDLNNGGAKTWGETPPYAALGRAALASAGTEFALGTAGAGYGAFAGALKGGLGSVSAVTADGITVGALAAVNSFGSVVGPDGCSFWAAPYEIGREFGGTDPGELYAEPDAWPFAKLDPGPRENTTVACVATDAVLTSAEAKRVAVMARAGLARAIRPVFAPFDGDVVFALATGRVELAEPRALAVARIGALAADCLARAVARGVYAARAWPGCPVEDWATSVARK